MRYTCNCLFESINNKFTRIAALTTHKLGELLNTVMSHSVISNSYFLGLNNTDLMSFTTRTFSEHKVVQIMT